MIKIKVSDLKEFLRVHAIHDSAVIKIEVRSGNYLYQVQDLYFKLDAATDVQTYLGFQANLAPGLEIKLITEKNKIK